MLESITNREMEYQKLSPEEMKKRGILGRLIGTIADFTSPTRNGRLYSEELWDKAFDSPIMKEKIENRCCLGELGHPTDRSETDIEKVAICLAEVPKKNKGVLQGVFDILDTPNGRILKTLCDYGCKIGVSSRGEGDTYVDFDGQESVDPNTYNLECWDAVLIPAVKAARPAYVTESLDSKKNHKTLKQSLKESLKNASEDDRKVMSEGLKAIGISLNEDADTSSYGFVPKYDYEKFVKVSKLLSDTLSKYDKIIDNIENSATTDEEKEALESNDTYQLLIDTFSKNYEDIYALEEIIKDGSLQIDDESKDSSIMLNMNIYTVNDLYDLLSNLNKIIENDSIKKYLNENLQYNGFDITITGSGVDLRKSDGTFVQHFSTEEEAKEYVDSLNESLLNEESTKEEDNKDESSEEDVDIDVTLEKDEGVIDPSDILEQLQASLLENKRLADTISKLQEKVSVCNAKDEKNESIILKQKQSINKLTESVKSNLALKRELSAKTNLIEQLNSKILNYENNINKLNEDLNSLKKEKSSLIKNETLYRKEISKKISKLQESIKSYDLNEDKYIDTVEGLKKDLLQKQNEFKLKLNQKEKLIEQYKKKSAFIVDKYIDLQASVLGIESSDIKNRLNENYSFKDIDRICEDYKNYTVNMNSLPFDTSVNLKVKNPFKQNLVPSKEDEVDDQLLRMSGLK